MKTLFFTLFYFFNMGAFSRKIMIVPALEHPKAGWWLALQSIGRWQNDATGAPYIKRTSTGAGKDFINLIP
jgi:hypothetical protein